MTNFRSLCARMADELDHYRQLLTDDRRETHALATEARALLDQPEPLPTHDLSNVAPLLWVLWNHLGARSPVGQPIREYLGMGQFQPMTDAQMAAANQYRALLWNSPQPEPEGPTPADGEVAELVETLKGISYWKRHGRPGEPPPASFDIKQANRLIRAADLLAQRYPQPVPVSERLPGAEDMTDDGEVWIEDPGHEYPLADAGDYDWEPHKWILRPIGKFDAQNGLRWLPAHDLPLPGEVEG